MSKPQDLTGLIWQIADLLRGPYRPPQYERVMLPMTVLRRFDCVLKPTKEAVLQEYKKRKEKTGEGADLDAILNSRAKQRFHNHSDFDFEKLKGAPDTIARDLVSYISGFSANVRRIFEYFEFEKEIEIMAESNILYLVVSKFSTVDLSPKSADGGDNITNVEMGRIFEHLIRKFNELANETAGDHFTPREVIRLMVNLLFLHDNKLLTASGAVSRMLDIACGTGGMLAEAQSYMRQHNPKATLYTYGQDYNKRAFATAASDMLLKEVAHNGIGENIQYGDSLLDDKFEDITFDYLIANPPFGVDWKKQQKEIIRRHEKEGFDGPFGAGLPRVNDGALLFLQKMIDKMEPVDAAAQKWGSRIAVVFSGSPLFTGGAGSGESNIRKWIIENDWLEGVVALPEQMFYNTGIGTYVWILTNNKKPQRRGKIALVDARAQYTPMRKSLGNKRRKIGEAEEGEADQLGDIVRAYGTLKEGPECRIFNNEDFGYTRVTVERPLRLRYQFTDEARAIFLQDNNWHSGTLAIIEMKLGRAELMDWNAVRKRLERIWKDADVRWTDAVKKAFRKAFTRPDPLAEAVKSGGGYESDPDLRDFENIPLTQDIDEYFAREVLPHVPDAWMDRSKDKVGYEINFNRYFYKHIPPRTLSKIDTELSAVEAEILRLLNAQALVTRAITCGLDSNISLKNSGIEWLGMIPEKWQVKKLKYVASLKSGDFITAEDITDEGEYPVYGGNGLRGYTCHKNRSGSYVLIGRQGALCGNINYAHGEFWASEHAVVCDILDGSDFYWLGELLRVMNLNQYSVAAAQPGLAVDAIKNLQIPFPPIKEQKQIAAFIKKETQNMGAIQFATERSIALLKERRNALITATVTGKLFQGNVSTDRTLYEEEAPQ